MRQEILAEQEEERRLQKERDEIQQRYLEELEREKQMMMKPIGAAGGAIQQDQSQLPSSSSSVTTMPATAATASDRNSRMNDLFSPKSPSNASQNTQGTCSDRNSRMNDMFAPKSASNVSQNTPQSIHSGYTPPALYEPVIPSSAQFPLKPVTPTYIPPPSSISSKSYLQQQNIPISELDGIKNQIADDKRQLHEALLNQEQMIRKLQEQIETALKDRESSQEKVKELEQLLQEKDKIQKQHDDDLQLQKNLQRLTPDSYKPPSSAKSSVTSLSSLKRQLQDNNNNRKRELNMDDLFKPQYPPPSTPYIPNISTPTEIRNNLITKTPTKSTTPTSRILVNNTPSMPPPSALPSSIVSSSQRFSNNNSNDQPRLMTPNDDEIPTISLNSPARKSQFSSNNSRNTSKAVTPLPHYIKAFDPDIAEESLPGLESQFKPITPSSSSTVRSKPAVPLNSSIMVDSSVNRIASPFNNHFSNTLDVYIYYYLYLLIIKIENFRIS